MSWEVFHLSLDREGEEWSEQVERLEGFIERGGMEPPPDPHPPGAYNAQPLVWWYPPHAED